METRTTNLIIGTSGGTAGGNATNFKLALPSTWVREMGLTSERRQVELRFDGTSIVITRKQSFTEFLESRRHAGHKLLLLSCYSGKTVCVENLAVNYLKLPFGKNTNPSWADYQHFLEDRCIPKTRAGLQQYLEVIGVDGYDPLKIIQKTQGRMAEDDLWLTVEDVK